MESFFDHLPLAVTLLCAVVGLILLVVSADFAISEAVATAREYDVSPLVVGTTLVAMSTSLAELAVNMTVTLSGGNNAVVVGNVFGSNLVNIGLGLGIPAMMTTIRTTTLVIEREILLYFAVTGLFTGFALERTINRLEGAILVGGFAIIMFLIYQYASRQKNGDTPYVLDEGDGQRTRHRPLVHALRAACALVVLVLAAEVLVSSTSVVARSAGISSYIISLTVIGIGTSLPEIATSIQAARRGHVDLVLGNVFGSNVFNICFAIGLPAVIRGIRVPAASIRDILFINVYGLAVALLLLGEYPFLGRNKVIARGGGAAVAAAYLGYLLYRVAIR